MFVRKPVKHIRISVSLLITAVILCLPVLYVGLSISTRMNASAADSGRYICSVTEVSYDLSGTTDMTVRLEGGAYAKISSYSGVPEAVPGDVLLIFGSPKEPEKAGNPGEFDYREYLEKKGICYILTCESYETVRKASFPLMLTGFLKRFFFDVRKGAVDCVSGTFDEGNRALTAALCVGDKSLVSDNVKRDFKMSCCTHLLAVSGTHFSGFLAGLPFILSSLKIKRKKAFAIYVAAAVSIGFLTGWGDSVTRAAFMSICFFAMRDWVSALSVASVVMVMADPFCPLSSGFQMSFCACIAIKVFSGRILSFLMKKLHLGEKLAGVISPCLSASLGMIPFWSDISMRPDLLHVGIQLTASFAAQAACTCFIPTVILCRLFPFLSQFLSTPLYLCLKLLSEIVSLGSVLSERSGAPIRLNNAFLLTLFITLFLFMLPPCLIRRLLLKVSALLLAVFIGFETYGAINKPLCTVVFADVGQGDCCLIMTPDCTCLIDGGTYEEGEKTVTELLDYYGIYQVDICIMSHWDVDHSGGIAALWKSGRTKRIVTPFVPSDEDNDNDVHEFFESTGLEVYERTAFTRQLDQVSAGDRIVLSDSVFIDVLYPLCPKSGGNGDSLVAMLRIADRTSILFTGDIGITEEQVLIESGIDFDCDILKVAHHGSKYSTSTVFIEACSPDIAVISVGKHNFYGHPSPDTLARLESYGCEVFRTDTEGAVVLEY